MPTARLLLLCAVSCGALSGCASLHIPFMNSAPQASARNPVVQIVCMWEPSEGRDPSGAPTRGFAGQILFLGNKGGTPVGVDGEVMVYVFDDLGTEEEQSAPIHQFRFDARAWNNHLKPGTLGPSYHCFIPYTRPGGMEANCTVRMRYTPTDTTQSVLLSDASHIAMRGRSRKTAESHYVLNPRVTYETSQPLPQRQVRTTTIPLLNAPNTAIADLGNSPATQAGPLSSEERTRQILDDYRREQAAKQQIAATAVPATPSPRIRLSSGNAPTETTLHDSSVMPASYSQPAVSNSHPLFEAGETQAPAIPSDSGVVPAVATDAWTAQ